MPLDRQVGSGRRSAGWLRSAALLVAAATVLTGWLLSSPPGSSPDDGFHTSSIWCARGFQDGICMDRGTGGVLIPAPLTRITCLAFQSDKSAECVAEALSLPSNELAGGARGNLGGERAGLYYSAMHTFVSPDIPRALMTIRLANLALVLTMVGLTMVVSTGAVRRAVATVWLVAMLPVGLFLVVSLNTSAWGLIGLGTFWANATTAIRSRERWRRLAATVLALLGMVLALGSRTEALGHLIVMVFAIGLLAIDEERSFHPTARFRSAPRVVRRRVAAALALIAIAIPLGMLRFVSSLDYLLKSTGSFGEGYQRLVDSELGQPWLWVVSEIPLMWSGALGDRFGLGWLDTTMPAIVYVLSVSIFAMLLALGLQGAARGRIAAVSVIVVGMFVLPAVTHISMASLIGGIYQPRHYLPLLLVLLGVGLVGDGRGRNLRIGRGTHLGMVAALAVSHGFALHTNIRRNVVGLRREVYFDLDRRIDWWWAHGPSPMRTWLIASIAYGLLAYLVLGMFRRSPASR